MKQGLKSLPRWDTGGWVTDKLNCVLVSERKTCPPRSEYLSTYDEPALAFSAITGWFWTGCFSGRHLRRGWLVSEAPLMLQNHHSMLFNSRSTILFSMKSSISGVRQLLLISFQGGTWLSLVIYWLQPATPRLWDDVKSLNSYLEEKKKNLQIVSIIP